MANSTHESPTSYDRRPPTSSEAPRAAVPQVNPEILQWARETAGLSLDDAADALGLKPERLAALEDGEREPTRPQLANMARRYRRSLLIFYLREPPRKGDRGEDFRTLPPDRSVTAEAWVDALLRDIRARQGLVRTVLEEEDEGKPLPFIGSMRVDQGVHRVAASMSETLRFDLARYRAGGSAADAFSYLRGCTESIGVFVMLIGDLGSYRTALPVELFRGFAIADPIAPFVVINDQDARTAWSFTLLHEVAHLWLGNTGVSGANPGRGIERFCNDVASELLLPARDLQTLGVNAGMAIDDMLARISQFATARHVSHSMVAYKLYVSGVLDAVRWREVDNTLRELWYAERERAKGRAGDSGPSYYVVRRHRLGPALLEFAGRHLDGGSLSPSRAARILGVKPRTVIPLLADSTRKRVGYIEAGS